MKKILSKPNKKQKVLKSAKEYFPRVMNSLGVNRGMHVISMDGPGQGNSNIQKIRAVADNYERAGAAVIDYLEKREEVDSDKNSIGVFIFLNVTLQVNEPGEKYSAWQALPVM